MASGLSVLARLIRKGAFEEFEQGLEGPRPSAYLPAKRGFTRGSLGATGVRSPGNPQTRDPNAAEKKDRQTIQQVLLGR